MRGGANPEDPRRRRRLTEGTCAGVRAFGRPPRRSFLLKRLVTGFAASAAPKPRKGRNGNGVLQGRRAAALSKG